MIEVREKFKTGRRTGLLIYGFVIWYESFNSPTRL